MSEKKEICMNCGDRYCCRGLCRKMNELLIQERNQNPKHEYLYDDTHIDKVYCFHIYEIE